MLAHLKIFGGKYSVESCWWKLFGRMGGDQLTGGVELTVGDELTGRGPTLNKAGRASMPVYITRLLATEFSAICLWKMNSEHWTDRYSSTIPHHPPTTPSKTYMEKSFPNSSPSNPSDLFR